MNALVVEDSPQIAERLVELVSVPDRVEVVATAATEDEALATGLTLDELRGRSFVKILNARRVLG